MAAAAPCKMCAMLADDHTVLIAFARLPIAVWITVTAALP